MKKRAFSRLWPVLIAALILLAGCTGDSQALSAAELKQASVYADPALDAMLAAIQSSDYTAFSANFDDLMKSILDESQFIDLKGTLDNKLGRYLGRSEARGSRNARFLMLSYTLQYEKNPGVVVRVTFSADEPHRIAGLVFDAPELQGG